MSGIFINVLIVSSIALAAAAILYFISKKFAVQENPRIDEIEKFLPGVNCGACGKAGCRDFANACASADIEAFKDLYCTVGGEGVMSKVAAYLGFETAAKEKTIAILRCQGTCQNAPSKFEYTGLKSCRMASHISTSSSECPNGCIRFGDCVSVCKFDALHLDPISGLPVVDENKCVSCGACVAICPKKLFEIHPKGVDNKRVYVACRNTQKGAIARKNCSAACIGCMKCTKINPEVIVKDNLSYIPITVDAEKYGQALAETCPTGAIIYISNKES